MSGFFPTWKTIAPLQEKRWENTNHTKEIIQQMENNKSLVSYWEQFRAVLKENLCKLCETSKAGRISNAFSTWTTITSDREI